MKSRMKRYENALAKYMDRFDWGKNQISKILAPVSFVVSLFTLLKVYNIALTPEQMVLCMLLSFGFIYWVGFVWDKYGLIDREIEYQNLHNKFIRTMLRKK